MSSKLLSQKDPRKSRKRIFSAVAVLGLLFCSPQKALSNVFLVKVGLGLTYGGHVDNEWTTTTGYFNQRTNTDVKKYFALQEYLELEIPVFRSFSLLLGAGHYSKQLKLPEGIFTLPASSSLSGEFSASPELHFRSIPISLTAKWSYTIWPEAAVYGLAGAAYYIGKFNIYEHDIRYQLQNPDETLNYFPRNFNGKTTSLGYHGGVGIEFNAGERIFLFAESLYRHVAFPTIERTSDGETGEGLIFLYWYNMGGDEAWGDISCRIHSLVLSEIIFQVGFKIQI